MSKLTQSQAVENDSNPAAKPRSGYAVTFTPHASGLVRVYHWPHAVEGMPGWAPTAREASLAAARQMHRLSEELLMKAYELTDDRGRGR